MRTNLKRLKITNVELYLPLEMIKGSLSLENCDMLKVAVL